MLGSGAPATFPRHPWVECGKAAGRGDLVSAARDAYLVRRTADSTGVVAGWPNVGFKGYFAGPGVHAIDPMALAEPLLARLPAQAGAQRTRASSGRSTQTRPARRGTDWCWSTWPAPSWSALPSPTRPRCSTPAGLRRTKPGSSRPCGPLYMATYTRRRLAGCWRCTTDAAVEDGLGDGGTADALVQMLTGDWLTLPTVQSHGAVRLLRRQHACHRARANDLPHGETASCPAAHPVGQLSLGACSRRSVSQTLQPAAGQGWPARRPAARLLPHTRHRRR